MSEPPLPDEETIPNIVPPRPTGRRRHLLIKLHCPKCGGKGHIIKVNEKVYTKFGMLDLPFYQCSACDERWFSYADVQGYVLLTQLVKKGDET